MQNTVLLSYALCYYRNEASSHGYCVVEGNQPGNREEAACLRKWAGLMEWAGDNISVMADFDTRFDEPCSEDHLADIFMLITDWRAVAPKLGLTEAEEIAILESTHSVPARKMAMLRRWKQKLGAKATYKRLVEAFKKCGLTDLEEKVVQMVTGSSTLKSAEVLPSPPSADHTGRSNTLLLLTFIQCSCVYLQKALQWSILKLLLWLT